MTYTTVVIANNLLSQFVADRVTAGDAIHFIFISPYTGEVYVTYITPAIP